jgi:catechol 2,3-dioxygenase-like lactoylglutathione lyase family enzyme
MLAIAPDTVVITRGGRPVVLPAESGGVTALKFRDPDGHPLELLSFAEHAAPRHWRDVATRAGGALTLGIDHSAFVVADAARWIDFGTTVLGLSMQSRQTNRGIAQARLDDRDDAVVDVVAMKAAAPHATPHLELLGYAYSPGDSRGHDDSGVHAVTVLQVDELAAMRARFEHAGHAIIEPRLSDEAGHTHRHGPTALATDPDDRALLLWQPHE